MRRLGLITILVLVVPIVLFAQINWTEHIVDSDFDGVTSVRAEDIDGDEDMDVVAAAMLGHDVAWWENSGDTMWIEHLVDTTLKYATSIFVEDVNGDGFVDIVAGALSDTIVWWENTDGTGTIWLEHLIDGNFHSVRSVYAEDVDGDGDIDVLGAAQDDNDIAWWENSDDTGTVWVKHIVDDNFGDAYSVYAEDVDGDSDMDVLGAAYGDNDIAWWENIDGTGTVWIEHLISTNFTQAISVYAKDVDDDGNIDVLAAALISRIAWWKNADDTGTVWVEHNVANNFGGARSVYAEDVDDDGDIDVLGAARNDNEIAWWENIDDTGTVWIEHSIATNFSYAMSVYAEDMDDDGDIDILGTAFSDDQIVWWESDLTDIYDVGPVSIDIPSVVPEDTTLYPLATVTNFGTHNESFVVTCEIDPGDYSRNRSVNDLAPGDSAPVTFLQQFTFEPGVYTVTVYTRFTDDENPVNDTIVKIIETYDPGITEGDEDTPAAFSFSTPTIRRSKAYIKLALPEATKVDLLVYDALGRVSETFVSERLPAGNHHLSVNLDLPAGVYFYNLKTQSGEDIMRKFLLIE